jgi:hypothetical protein
MGRGRGRGRGGDWVGSGEGGMVLMWDQRVGR